MIIKIFINIFEFIIHKQIIFNKINKKFKNESTIKILEIWQNQDNKSIWNENETKIKWNNKLNKE
jgi:hypothetical protein